MLFTFAVSRDKSLCILAAFNVKQCGNNSLINYILSIGLDTMIISAEKNII